MGFYLTEQSTDTAAENRPATGRPRLVAKTPIGAPFGKAILSTKYWDSDTKTLAYQLRDYGPGIGRWLSRDPIEESGGINLYAFVDNSSIMRVDPLGEKFWDPTIFNLFAKVMASLTIKAMSKCDGPCITYQECAGCCTALAKNAAWQALGAAMVGNGLCAIKYAKRPWLFLACLSFTNYLYWDTTDKIVAAQQNCNKQCEDNPQ